MCRTFKTVSIFVFLMLPLYISYADKYYVEIDADTDEQLCSYVLKDGEQLDELKQFRTAVVGHDENGFPILQQVPCNRVRIEIKNKAEYDVISHPTQWRENWDTWKAVPKNKELIINAVAEEIR